MKIKTDCRYYRGDIPCRPHKKEGVHCEACSFYDPVKEKILIIKLGAIGDVIRTTPLLHKLKDVYPHAQIHWLTLTPDILPNGIDRIFPYDLKSTEIIKQIQFDIVYNLDKDREACALTNQIQSKVKKGFFLKDGTCYPFDKPAEEKWMTGLFDDINQKNRKSYLQEIFEICGFEFKGEEYILDVSETQSLDLPDGKPVIGLNTGCGIRWKSRLWPESHWIRLACLLKEKGFMVLLLGGEQEDEKNKKIAQSTGAIYPGHFTLPVFMELMNQCDLVVTAVTMALHIALGLHKKVVLFNNIFNPHEFELYGQGIILEPHNDCKGCFMNDCDKTCMELILPDEVAQAINTLFQSK